MGVHSRINTALLIVLLTLVVLVIVYVYGKTKAVRRGLLEMKKALMPRLSQGWYENITFPRVWPDREGLELRDSHGCLRTPALAAACSLLMATYNIATQHTPPLPTFLRLTRLFGTHGLLFETHSAYVVCFRGTLDAQDVLNDIDALQTAFVDARGVRHDKIRVHRGFQRVWDESKPDFCTFERMLVGGGTSSHARSLADRRSLVATGLRSKAGKHVLIIGHSLGGSTAYMAALSLVSAGYKGRIGLVTFGTPKVGDEGFVRAVCHSNIDNCIVINQNDVVPLLPPPAFSFGGETCLYAAFDGSLQLNVQTGSVRENHALHVYAYGLCGRTLCERTVKPLWMRKPVEIKSTRAFTSHITPMTYSKVSYSRSGRSTDDHFDDSSSCSTHSSREVL